MNQELSSGNISELDQQLKGSNQSNMRAYNERLVLSLVRRKGPLPKMKIAQMTGLSAQTISVIMRSLEADGLLLKGEPVRGKVGQPSVPLSLNPDGVFFLGLKIGRRSSELILVDFLGKVKKRTVHTYPFPEPDDIENFALKSIKKFESDLGKTASKISGLGVAMPFELWNWTEAIGTSIDKMESWKTYDIQKILNNNCSYPVYIQNDATAACGAELAFGANQNKRDFAYFYIGTFIGGGLVINGRLFIGKNGNAGALGSMLISDRTSHTKQLIDEASIVTFEKQLQADDIDPSPLWNRESGWQDFNEKITPWVERVASGLAQAIISTTALIDQETTVIDGAFPEEVRRRIVEATREALKNYNQQGIEQLVICEGSLGTVARALGGASLPLFDRYLVDQNISLNQ
ncbi:ROK family transcriptional regulator [Kiloniella spongiae]|uniref:ROK family transcriptional regulator n=1 Tax=Kiloniella spongiae TaxID=1489064 RepID=A0A0H2MC57_9PROT|nr:ROK family transcriptional regulator [Kiloniella spongiae]KLN59791.1 ROK family transcriptional regulator [Kiloniella spongiae]